MISDFLGLSATAAKVEKSHDYAGTYVKSPIDTLDAGFLKARLARATDSLMVAAETILPKAMTERLAAATKAADRAPDRWSAKNLDPRWQRRSQIAVRHVPPGATLLDIGCGAMAIESLLPPGCKYIPVDIIPRDDRTIVCDLNSGQFPPLDGVTHVSMLGVLEYLRDPASVFQRLGFSGTPLISTYVTLDPSFGPAHRRSMGWINDLSRDEFVSMAEGAGYRLTHEERFSDNTLFVFSPS